MNLLGKLSSTWANEERTVECCMGRKHGRDTGLLWLAVDLFDERIEIYGDEEEWERRLISKGGSHIVYLPGRLVVAPPERRGTAPESSLLMTRFRRGRHEIRAAEDSKVADLLEARLESSASGSSSHGFRRQCAWGFLAASSAAFRAYL